MICCAGKRVVASSRIVTRLEFQSRLRVFLDDFVKTLFGVIGQLESQFDAQNDGTSEQAERLQHENRPTVLHRYLDDLRRLHDDIFERRWVRKRAR